MDELGSNVVKKGPATDNALIEAVRNCAKAGMSFTETAERLTTERHPLTRSAIGGIAHRNGIAFKSRRQGSAQPRVPAEKRLKYITPIAAPPAPKTQAKPYADYFGVKTPRAMLKKPPARCSWTGCVEYAIEGDMFCLPHGRKGLL